MSVDNNQEENNEVVLAFLQKQQGQYDFRFFLFGLIFPVNQKVYFGSGNLEASMIVRLQISSEFLGVLQYLLSMGIG